jgi:hypothetical protein
MLWLLDMIHNTASGYEVSSSTNLQDYEVSLSIFTCHGSKSHYLLLHLEPMERDHFNLSTRLSPQQGRLVFENRRLVVRLPAVFKLSLTFRSIETI